jgi:dihydrodipicolinate synthase/N-acetylneuraminate lyase
VKPLASHEIKGTWAAVLLPIDERDEIDLARLDAELEVLLASGVDGLYTNGTASEFYTQSEAEFDRIHEMVAGRCEAAGMPFQIGASHTSPQACLDRVRRALRHRPSAIQVILPDWFPVGDSEAVAFLSRVAEAASPISLVLYNPPHAKRVLQPEDFGRLKAAVPALAGIKVAGGDRDWYARMRQSGPDLSVFVPGHHLATGIRHGAAGSYSNVACLNPAAAQQWYRLMTRDMDAAAAVEQRLRDFMDQHILPYIRQEGFSNQAVDKLLAAIGGWAPVGTRLRWPYRWISQADAERLRPAAREIIPEFISNDASVA